MLTRGELAMMAFGWAGVDDRIALIRGDRACPWSDVKKDHPYAGALLQAEKAGCLRAENGAMGLSLPASGRDIAGVLSARLGAAPKTCPDAVTHGDFFLLAAELL